ncbi:MAG: hypothetical protein AAFP67_10580 [Pseudomonadota bacterium]
MSYRAAFVLTLSLGAAGCAAPGDLGQSLVGPIHSAIDRTQPTVVARRVEIAEIPSPSSASLTDRRIRNLIDDRTEVLSMQASRNRLSLVEPDGCQSTRFKDWFSPSVAWSGCGTSRNWHKARAEVDVLESLYPLRIGATGQYRRFATSHTGKCSERTTNCLVRDAVTLDLGRRDADAFEVRCDDGRVERVTWYAPGEGPIAYREAHHRTGVREAWVLAD